MLSATASGLAAEVKVGKVESHPASGGDATIISLKGAILRDDPAKLEQALKPLLNDHHDSSDLRGHIILDLSSEGQDYYAGLALATIVKKFKITTYVSDSSKCQSACALVFMAGRTISTFGSAIEPDRVLHVGGTLHFHAPFDPWDKERKFAAGVKAIRQLQIVLGEALPTDLLIAMLAAGPSEHVSVDTVYDAANWNIDLVGYREPKIGREELLNACTNHRSFRLKQATGPIMGERAYDHYDPDYREDFFLTDSEGEAVVDSKGNSIRRKNYQLYDEGSEDLLNLREATNFPNLLRLVDWEGGNTATSFAFEAGDTPDAFRCTALKVMGRSEVYVLSGRNIDLSKLQRALTAFWRENQVFQGKLPPSVPGWFLFPPGFRIVETKEIASTTKK
jgi:hypothetical protein